MSLAGWENAEVLQLKLDSSLIDADLTDFVVDVQLGAAVGKTGFDATAPFDDLTPLVVDDDFTGIDGDAPDVRLWNDVQYSSLDTTGNVVPDIRNNSLDFALSVVESYPYISSKYMLSGDFDIQVDYVIDAIPSIDTAWSLSLVTQTDHTDVFHTGANFASSARYSIVAGPYRANTEGGTASTGGSSDTSGKLRIARSGSTCNLYYWGGSSWTLLHTDTSYTTADVYVLLFSRIWTDNKSLNVNFDNFVINSGTIVWPNTPKKMAFEVGDTGVQCFGEIVSWDYTNKLAHLCIKVPTATAATDPILNFYRDPAHADNTTYIGDTGSTPAQTVHSGRVFASHQAQDPSGTAPQILDSSPNAAHATANGSMTSADLVDGLVGKALDLDGTDDFLSIGSVIFSSPTEVTWRCVVKSNVSDTTEQRIIAINNDGLFILTAINVGTANLIKVYANGVGGGVWSSTTTAYPVTDLRVITGRVKGGYLDLFVDGDKIGTPVAVTTLADLGFELARNIGVSRLGAKFTNGIVDEVCFTQAGLSDAWIKADNAALRDNLITWSLPGSTVAVLAALDQPYNLSLDPVLAALAQEYHLTVAVKNALAQVWAHIIEVALNQYYGDADKIMSALSQHYHDAPQVMRALVQKYDDMVQTTTALGQQYNLMFKAETSLEQNWAVCGFQATAGLVQAWDLRLRNEVMAALGQYWGLFRDRQDVQVPLFWVMADGVLLNPTEFTWTISGNASANQCTIPLADHGVWRSIQLHGHLEIHWNGITYQFFVEEKTRTRSVSGKEFTANYILKGLSITAALEAPYALPISREWPQDTMASVIVAELAAIEGVEVDWRIDDFPVWAGTFSVSNQTPLTAIKSLIGSATVEAVVQCSPEGKLIVRHEITVSPAKWKETKADHVIYDDGGVFSDSDDRDVMPGHNYIEISNQIESDSRKWLEPEKISATAKRVRGYAVPWVDDFPLDTSGGSWVTITDKGPKTEEIAGELVEFIDGAGSLSKPFYKQDLQGKLYPLAITWLLDDLGDVSTDEDGSLISTVPGNSLARVSYLTKYREWTVQDQEIESVQVFIPGEEVTA